MTDGELIERITKEVVAGLAARGQGADAPHSGVAAAGGAAARKGASGPHETQARKVLIPADLPPYIDHTLLKADATEAQIDQLCDEAMRYKFYSVCVNGGWAARCARRLAGSGVKVACVVGFPLGAMTGRQKNFEARQAIDDGAREIDMVMNVGAMRSRNLKAVEEDILWVRRACSGGVLLKVILENALLTDEEKVLACEIAKKAGADFVKTSTGFSTHGATVADVALMRRTVGPKMGVKAAGGIRSFADAVAMVEAGATRLGTSAGVKIVSGESAQGAY